MNQTMGARPNFGADYTPAKFLQVITDQLKLKNDAALSRALDVPQSVISKIRSEKAGVSAMLLIRAHDLTGLPIAELRRHLGNRYHIGWGRKFLPEHHAR